MGHLPRLVHQLDYTGNESITGIYHTGPILVQDPEPLRDAKTPCIPCTEHHHRQYRVFLKGSLWPWIR